MLTVINLQEIALITVFVVSFSLLGHYYRHSVASLYIFSAALGLHLALHFLLTPNLITKMCVASNLVLLRKDQLASDALDQQKARLFDSYRQFYR